MAGASGSTVRGADGTLRRVRRTSVCAAWLIVIVGAGFSPTSALAAPAEPSPPSTSVQSPTSTTEPGNEPGPTTPNEPGPTTTEPAIDLAGVPVTTVVVAVAVAVVAAVGDVATGPPPIVPQLASQSIVREPTATSQVPPRRPPMLPVTGVRPARLSPWALAALMTGWLMRLVAVRRRAV